MSRPVVATLAAMLALAGATAALAATPGSGSVSKAEPQVTWTGAVTTSYPNRIPVILTEDDTFPCLPQTCDMFTLDVKDSDDLTIKADAPEGTSTDGSSGSQVTLRIRKPDGSVSVHTTDQAGASPEKPLTVKLKKAPVGTYEIEYFNYFYGPPVEYAASATLGGAAPAPVAPPPPAPAPPAVQEELTVSAQVSGASARKLNRAKKLKAAVTVSRPVRSLTATLKKGSRTVGKGRLGAFTGTKTLSLKLSKKLKAGTYSLSLTASDGAGASARRTIPIKVKK